MNWSKEAEGLGLNSQFSIFGDSFLCECKNYAGKVGVTYVGKFYSLMRYTKTKFGIFVSWNGVTGKDGDWQDAIGLIKKIALGDNNYIIVISKNDLQKIYDNSTTIFALIEDKYRALKNDISYTEFISKHPNEDEGEWKKVK